MPIYEYRCSACGFEKEFLQKVSDPRLTDCPECGKSTFEKLVSAAGFQLKGNGWYATDFRNSGSKPKAEKEKSEKSEAAEPKKEEKKSDSKPESSTPAAS